WRKDVRTRARGYVRQGGLEGIKAGHRAVSDHPVERPVSCPLLFVPFFYARTYTAVLQFFNGRVVVRGRRLLVCPLHGTVLEDDLSREGISEQKQDGMNQFRSVPNSPPLSPLPCCRVAGWGGWAACQA